MGFFDFMYKGGTPRIFALEAHKKLHEGVPLIDIREIYEWNRAHVPGAIHVPAARLTSYLSDHDKSKEIMLICTNGDRSLLEAQRLIDLGYTAVSVHGGTNSWKASGYPLEK